MRSFEEVKSFFTQDIYATCTTGIEIVDARPGYAIVRLQVDERHMNAANRVMGAVYYTMADFALRRRDCHPLQPDQFSECGKRQSADSRSTCCQRGWKNDFLLYRSNR